MLPLELRIDFIRHKSLIDLDTNLIMQKALALYLSNGMFSKNLKNQIHFFFTNRGHYRDIFTGNQMINAYHVTPTDLIIKVPKKTIIPTEIKNASHKIINNKKSIYVIFKLRETLAPLLEDWIK